MSKTKFLFKVLLLQVLGCAQSCGITMLTANSNGVASLNISWASSCYDTFNLRMNSIDVLAIEDQYYYIFNITDSTSCKIYEFQVEAKNGPMNSSQSEIIRSSFPSLPNVSPVQDSLEYSLFKMSTSEGVLIEFTFDNATFCPGYPIAEYNAVLDDGISDWMEILVNDEFERFAILLTGSSYLLTIRATNDVGTAETAPIRIFTTDVQEVDFTREYNNTFSIMCYFINGSDVNGCFYILMSRLEVLDDVTGFIAIDSIGETIEVANIGCYVDLLAYDWEIGMPISSSTPVRATFNFTNEECLLTDSTTTDAPSSWRNDLRTGLSISGAAIVIAIAVIVVVYIVYLRTHGYCDILYKFDDGTYENRLVGRLVSITSTFSTERPEGDHYGVEESEAQEDLSPRNHQEAINIVAAASYSSQMY